MPLGTSCGAQRGEVRALAPPPAEAPDPAAYEFFAGLTGGLVYANPPVAPEASDPSDGAVHQYDRTPSANGRKSPVDVEMFVYDERGSPLHTRAWVKQRLQQIHDTIYGWEPAKWRSAGVTDPVVREKADFFWELLAQHVAEAVFGSGSTRRLFVDGPECLEERASTCAPRRPVADARTVVVKSHIDGARDPLMPVSRTLYTAFRATDLTHPTVWLEIAGPHGLVLAAPEHPRVNAMPSFRGAAPARIALIARAGGLRPRSQNADYPDYNLLYAPFRHLALENRAYKDVLNFAATAKRLHTSLQVAATARPLADALAPYVTEAAYPKMNDLAAYRSYLIDRIGAGLKDTFADFEIRVDGRRP